MKPFFLTACLLAISNTFMTFAWYWQLWWNQKHARIALWLLILISWGIAGLEYCFAVPATRIGSDGGMSGGQLKILQEAITLIVFTAFSVFFLHEPLKWQYILGVTLVFAGVFVINYL